MKKTILLSVYSLWILIPIFLIIKSIPFSEYKYYMISLISGSIAFSIFSFNVLLISRIRFIESNTGLDKLLIFHGIAAISASAFTLVHGAILRITNLMSTEFIFTLGLIALILFSFIMLFSVIFLIKGKFGNLFIIHTVRQFFKNILSLDYEKIKLIHNSNIIILIIAYIHVIYISQILSTFYSLTTTIQLILALSSFLYLKIVKPYILKLHPYTVSDVILISNNITTVAFNKQDFSYLPGQFGFIRFIKSKIANKEHPFTISSSPLDDHISITVKAIGDFSSSLRLISKGDIAAIDGPYGVFSYVYHNCSTMVFFAGGIGITPFLSMVRHIASRKNKSVNTADKAQIFEAPKKVVLFWSAKKKDELVYLNELELFKSLIDFTIHVRLTEEKNENFVFGKFTYETISDLLKIETGNNNANTNYFICGPYSFSTAVKKILKKLKISFSNIKQEFFV